MSLCSVKHPFLLVLLASACQWRAQWVKMMCSAIFFTRFAKSDLATSVEKAPSVKSEPTWFQDYLSCSKKLFIFSRILTALVDNLSIWRLILALSAQIFVSTWFKICWNMSLKQQHTVLFDKQISQVFKCFFYSTNKFNHVDSAWFNKYFTNSGMRQMELSHILTIKIECNTTSILNNWINESFL